MGKGGETVKTVHVNATFEYDVHIGGGLMHQAGTLMAQTFRPNTVALITDENVAQRYLQTVEQSLTGAGFKVHRLILSSGEGTKSLQTLEEILDFLCERELTRSGILVALGGGVIGDAVGFAASVYLRGIPYVQIPTTFLSAIDSSVGGKTAINLRAGKNLAGSFWQPKLVICDTDALQSLPEEIFAEGIAEAIKYGMLGSKELFLQLKDGLRMQEVEDVIAQCVAMKAEVVGEDEFDEGRRQLLNFGHTVGHAIETCSGLAIHHGIAVGIGMVIASRAAWRRGFSEEDCTQPLREALLHNGLPDSCSFSAAELAQAAMGDKKRRGGNITLILPKRVGLCERVQLPVSELQQFIQDGLSR